MANVRAFALGAVALVALSRAAVAADLLPPPPAFEPPPPISAPEMGGWYIRGDVGVGVNNSPNFETTPDALAVGRSAGSLSASAFEGYYNPAMSEAALLDFGVGYQVNSWFRADVTGELRGGASFHGLEVVTDTKPAQYYADLYKTNVTSYLAMLNGYADLGTWYGVTPFVGAGVGVAFNRAWGGEDVGVAQGSAGSPSQGVGGMLSSGNTTNLAWALMAGFDFNVTRNLKLELGYRYLDYGKFKTGGSSCYAGAGSGAAFSSANCTGGGYKVASKELTSNDFRIGLRYYFDQPAPLPPPDMPLVRKY